MNDHQWTLAPGRELIAAVEKVSGAQLRSWLKDWIETPGVNGMQVDFRCDAARKISSFRILQFAGDQSAPLRSHRIRIVLLNKPDGADTFRVYDSRIVSYIGAATEIGSLKGLDCPDAVVPNLDGKDYVNVHFDERSRETLLHSLEKVEDSDVRRLVYELQWLNLLRQEVLPASAADFLQKALLWETDQLNKERLFELLADGQRSGQISVLELVNQKQFPDVRVKIAASAKIGPISAISSQPQSVCLQRGSTNPRTEFNYYDEFEIEMRSREHQALCARIQGLNAPVRAE